MTQNTDILETALAAQQNLLENLQGIHRIRPGRPEHYAKWAGGVIQEHLSALNENKRLVEATNKVRQRSQAEASRLNNLKKQKNTFQLDDSQEGIRNRGMAHLLESNNEWFKRAGLVTRTLVSYSNGAGLIRVNPKDIFEHAFENTASDKKLMDKDAFMLSFLWSFASEILSSEKLPQYASDFNDKEELFESLSYLRWLHMENGLLKTGLKNVTEHYSGETAATVLGNYIYWLTYRLINIVGYCTYSEKKGPSVDLYGSRLEPMLKQFDNPYGPENGGLADEQAKKVVKSLMVVWEFFQTIPFAAQRAYIDLVKEALSGAGPHENNSAADMRKAPAMLNRKGAQGSSFVDYPSR